MDFNLLCLYNKYVVLLDLHFRTLKIPKMKNVSILIATSKTANQSVGLSASERLWRRSQRKAHSCVEF